MSVHFSSKTGEWGTPQALFDLLDAEFHFTLDVCATPENAKCRRYFTKKQDGLSRSWVGERFWMNPPYGREIGAWIKHAADSCTGENFWKGTVGVCLLPARTDTAWWHDWVWYAAEVRFIRGRLKFGGATNSAPFPSAVVIFNDEGAKVGDSYSHRYWDWRKELI